MVQIYRGPNAGERSLNVLANQVHERTGWPVIDKISQLDGQGGVFNLVVEDMPKVEQQRRFSNVGRHVVLWASNTQEYSLEERLGLYPWMSRATLIAHSPYHRDVIREDLTHFSPAYRKSLLKGFQWVQAGITEEFSPVPEVDGTGRDRWMVPANRWQLSQKNLRAHTELMSKFEAVLAQKGSTLEGTSFYCMDPKPEDVPYNVYDCPKSRADYVDNCRWHGMFLCTSNYESLGLMPLEMLACGQVGVFLDKPWVRKLLPGYPFIAHKSDLVQLMLAVYNDYDKARRHVVEQTVPFIKAERSMEVFVDRVKEMFHE